MKAFLDKKFLEGVSVLAGMIIGVGMFGIPYAFARMGFWPGVLELAVLVGVVLLFHLLYGEVVLDTPEFHRLPGYAQIYLGRFAVLISRFSALFGIAGVLLAYILLGSQFLQNISGQFGLGGNNIVWALAISLFSALITFLPLRREAAINGILTAGLIVFACLLSFYLIFYRFSAVNLAGFNPANIFVPYGVLLFALSGGAVIPDLVMVMGRDRVPVRRAIGFGTLLPAVIYFIFALAMVGVFGSSVSEEAIFSLALLDGGRLVFFGSVIGFLAVITSLIVLGKNFQLMLNLDFGVPPAVSWALASFVPFLLYLAGFQNFIAIIGAVGAIAVGIDSVLTIAIYHQMRRAQKKAISGLSYIWKFGICILIAAGVFYELSKIPIWPV